MTGYGLITDVWQQRICMIQTSLAFAKDKMESYFLPNHILKQQDWFPKAKEHQVDVILQPSKTNDAKVIAQFFLQNQKIDEKEVLLEELRISY